MLVYKSKLSINQTQKAIEIIKSEFPKILSEKLNLTRVSAPLFVDPVTGLNDGLNGEQPVSFTPVGKNKTLEVVHSLAKWKRKALEKYHFTMNEGLYADMNAIRREEITSPFHSFYVDQWDWEKIISPNQRTQEYLQDVVKKIYRSIRYLEEKLNFTYSNLTKKLPKEIFFIDSQTLEDMYPQHTPEMHETLLVREKKAVFIMQIGAPLKSGKPHSGRAVDYDDWKLNGDIIVYHPVLDSALELSSMGIRVDADALMQQSKKTYQELLQQSPYHKEIVNETLPFSIGGGIGQSRLCMFLLEKAHIGEVQSSYWSDEELEKAQNENIELL